MKSEIREFKEEYLIRLKNDAKELFDKNLPVLTEEKFSLTERTGNRIIYEKDYFERRRFLCVFGVLAIYDSESRKEYIDRLEYVMSEICKERCWALPAHVDRFKDKNWERYVDLFASETGEALAEIIYRIGDELDADLVGKVRDNILKRVIEPYEERKPYDGWEQSEMNWNAVCNGSIGLISLYLLESDKTRQRALVNRVCDNLGYFLEGFGDDGTCYEGLSYFTYGMYFYMAFMEQLGKNGDYKNLCTLPQKCEAVAEFQQKCFFNSGLTLSFSDGSENDRYRIGLTSGLAMRFHGVTIPPVSSAAHYDFDKCYRFLMTLRDLEWTDEYIKTDNRSEDVLVRNCYVLKNSQWGICISQDAGMACKGGNNDEPHNHNDVGSFFYVAGDEFLLTDLGAGEYTKEYFDDTLRYGVFCNNSLSHNLPVIDGSGQMAGKQYACDKFESDGEGFFKYSIKNAYGNWNLTGFERELIYDFDTDNLTVRDEFVSSGCLIEENLVTQQDVTIKEDEIFIKGKKHSCRIIIDALSPEIRILDEVHVDHEGNAEAVKRIIWTVAPKGYCGKCSCKFKIEKVE